MLLFSTIIVVIYVTISNDGNDWTIKSKKHTVMLKINQLQLSILAKLIYNKDPKIG
jgi:hypothetical protein